MNIARRLLLLIAVASLTEIACQKERTIPSPASAVVSNAAPLNVITSAVTRGAEATISTPARIRSRQSATLSSRVPAVVMSLPFREGDTVRAGVVLVRLDDAPQQAAVSSAEALLQAAESDNRRVTSLLSKSAATPREAEGAKTRLETARSALAAARDGLSTTVIRAPFAGRIVSKPANVGDLANPGSPLLELQGGSALELVTTLEPMDVASIRVGQKLRVRVDSVDREAHATVYSIAPAADDSTHRVDVLLNLDADPGLKPGLFARVELPVAKAGEAGPLSIPTNAVLRRGGLTGVFAVKDGRAFLRWIALGRDLGQRVEVRAGLVEGESVVLSPGGLMDGAAVNEARR
jgi:RND family efflux transporter MFP subunit